ncbi:MAG: HAMP domain-containing sensor histidine kinase, partial [Candidatus Pacebacteria bacterium]|nr:HAMP domain-containing sensor histidine kinase [Candidatus Paceibacterota bacterium]
MSFGTAAVFLIDAYFFLPEEGIKLTRQQVRKTLVSRMVFLLMSEACEMFMDRARDALYDEVKNYSEKVQQAIADKETFFATMSHEIRNPLQTLLGSVDLLQLGHSSHASSQLGAIVKNCSEVVLNLVTNILDVSKIDAQKLELSPTPGNLEENINKILRLSVGRARAKGLKLTYVESNPLPPCLSFDPQRLHQVILNL